MDKFTQNNPLGFKKFTVEDVPGMREYFANCKLHLSDYSAAFQVMWREYFLQYYAFVEDCLVFAEFFRGRLYFHYPISLTGEGAEERALDAIERSCRESGMRIHYTAVPKDRLCKLIDRYGAELKITNPRKWRDYIYAAEDFVAFAGKKYAGQRNHINKFKKLYPDYEYVTLTSADSAEVKEFLKVFEKKQLGKGTLIAREEIKSVYELVDMIDHLQLNAGGIRVDGRLAAISIGEICGDMLIVHVEKALTEYEGIYCTMANEFAKHAVTEAVTLINREDDAGDKGLRKSKLQYKPIALGDKFTVLPHRIIDGMTRIPDIKSGRIEIREITDTEAQDFYRLEYDKERNRWWGYDWREHYKGEPTAEHFLRGIREDFAAKEEVPMGIFVECKLAGEVVLHNFGYRGDCEIGVRLLPEYEGQGYAKEALLAAMDCAFFDLNVETIYAKCFKQNERSRKTLLSAGMKANGEDDAYYYFVKTAEM